MTSWTSSTLFKLIFSPAKPV